jgi:transcriptional regulator with XRE-family HTH domain
MVRPARRNRVASLHSDSYTALVEMLVERRKASGLTQQKVADALGWPQAVIAKIETQERRIDAVELVQLAAVVGFDPARLVRDLQKLMISRREIKPPK